MRLSYDTMTAHVKRFFINNRNVQEHQVDSNPTPAEHGTDTEPTPPQDPPVTGWSDSKKWQLDLLSSALVAILAIAAGVLVSFFAYQFYEEEQIIKEATTIQRVTKQNELIYQTAIDLADLSRKYSLSLGPYLHGNASLPEDTGPYSDRITEFKLLEQRLTAGMGGRYESEIRDIFEPLLCECKLHKNTSATSTQSCGHVTPCAEITPCTNSYTCEHASTCEHISKNKQKSTGEYELKCGHISTCGHNQYPVINQGILKYIHDQLQNREYDNGGRLASTRSEEGMRWKETLSDITADMIGELYCLAEINAKDALSKPSCTKQSPSSLTASAQRDP